MNGDDNQKQQALTKSDQAPTPVQGEIWPAETLIQLERDRIDSYNRRTDVARQAVEANEAADQRQFNFHMEKLKRDSEDRADRRVTGFRMLWVFISVATVSMAFFAWMAFFGDDVQRQIAMDLIGKLVNGIAGFGIIWAIIYAFKRLIASE